MNEHAIDRIRRNLSDKYNSWTKTKETKKELEKYKKYEELKGIILIQQNLLKETTNDLASIVRLFQSIKGKEYEKVFLANISAIIREYSELLEVQSKNLHLKQYSEYEKNINSEKNLDTKLSIQADIFLGKHTSTTEVFGKTVTKMATGLALVLVVCFSTITANSQELLDKAFPNHPLTEQIKNSNTSIPIKINYQGLINPMDTTQINDLINKIITYTLNKNDTTHAVKGLNVNIRYLPSSSTRAMYSMDSANTITINAAELDKIEYYDTKKVYNPGLPENFKDSINLMADKKVLEMVMTIIHETKHAIYYNNAKERHDKIANFWFEKVDTYKITDINLLNNIIEQKLKYDFELEKDAINEVISTLLLFMEDNGVSAEKIKKISTLIKENKSNLEKVKNETYGGYKQYILNEGINVAKHIFRNAIKGFNKEKYTIGELSKIININPDNKYIDMVMLLNALEKDRTITVHGYKLSPDTEVRIIKYNI